MLEYRELSTTDFDLSLFSYFIRHQEVKQCWRKENGEWKLKDIAFTEDFSKEDYIKLLETFKEALLAKGTIVAAFVDKKLKAFAVIDGKLYGSQNQYADLLELYVSEDYRRKGIGAKLFEYSLRFASTIGAKKLYISAHSSKESIDFYIKNGCIEAKEYLKFHTEKEPCDCQLECPI